MSEPEKLVGASPRLSGVMARAQRLQKQVKPTARRIVEWILAKPQDVIHMSITDLAKACDASEGSVIAVCKQLGATGFQQLKIVLAQELVQPVQFIHEDLTPHDSDESVIEKIFTSNMQALQDTRSVLDPGSVSAAIEAIWRARRVELYGIGSAAPVVEDAYYRMLRIGLDCRVIVDSHIQSISASLVDSSVTTLTVSHSGSTHETLAATRLAQEAGATTICITNFGKSPLQKYTDIALYTMARETRFRTEAMTSRIAQLAVVDTLIAGLALRNHEVAAENIRKTAEVLAIKRF